MHRFLVEVSSPEAEAGRSIRQAVGALGSHFATHAGWRPAGGRSVGTLVVEADDWRGALAVVPPAMRGDARVFRLEAIAA